MIFDNKIYFSDASKQTKKYIEKSTQTDSQLKTSGSSTLRSYNVYVADVGVYISGNFNTNDQFEVTSTPNKTNVRFCAGDPGEMGADNVLSSRCFSVRFLSPPKPNHVAKHGKAEEMASTEWNNHDLCTGKSDLPFMENVNKDSAQIKRTTDCQKSLDSGLGSYGRNSFVRSDQDFPMDKCKNDPAIRSINGESDSELLNDCTIESMPQSIISPKFPESSEKISLSAALSIGAASSETYSSITGSAPRLEFTHKKEIRAIADSIQREGNARKASDIILEHLVTYQLKHLPKLLREKYKSPLLLVARFMFKQCAFVAGWGVPSGVLKDRRKEEKLYPVFLDYGVNLHPDLMHKITNDSNMFERIAEGKQFRAQLLQWIYQRFLGEIKDIDIEMLYECLSFHNLKGVSKSRKQYIKQNSIDCLNKCDQACVRFIIDFCDLLDNAAPLSKEACNHIFSEREIKSKIGSRKQRELITTYSRDLLKECLKLRMGVDLLERKLLPDGLAPFQGGYKDGIELQPETDYSGIKESDREFLRKLLAIMDSLEEEVNNLVTERENDINRLARADKEGQSFEKRVLELTIVDKRYAFKNFQHIRTVFNLILEGSDPSPRKIEISQDGGCGSQSSVI